MKRFTVIVFTLTVLLAGCKPHTDNSKGWLDDSIAFKEQIANNFGFELVGQDESESQWHIWRNSDGMTYCDTMGYAPCNEKVIVRDAQGRILVLAGRASECMVFSAVKYLYSEDGTIDGYVLFGGDIDFGYVEPPADYLDDSLWDTRYYVWPNEYYETTSMSSSIAAEVAELALTTTYDAPYYIRFYFDRNEDGQIVSVYDPIFNLRFDAPYDGQIKDIVKESIFGGSDIDCNIIKLIFLTCPLDPTDKYFRPDTIIWYSKYSEYRQEMYPIL